MAVASWREMSEFEHFVQFCETDDYLVQSVSKFISAGLMAGDATIILATQAHREGIEESLQAEGLALTAARAWQVHGTGCSHYPTADHGQ